MESSLQGLDLRALTVDSLLSYQNKRWFYRKKRRKHNKAMENLIWSMNDGSLFLFMFVVSGNAKTAPYNVQDKSIFSLNEGFVLEM